MNIQVKEAPSEKKNPICCTRLLVRNHSEDDDIYISSRTNNHQNVGIPIKEQKERVEQ